MATQKRQTKKTAKKETQKAKQNLNAAAADTQEAARNVRDAAMHAGRGLAARALEMQKQAISVQRRTFDGAYQALTSLSERQEDAITSWVEGSERVPVAVQKMTENWVWASRTRRGVFHQAMEKSFEIAEEYVDNLAHRVAAQA